MFLWYHSYRKDGYLCDSSLSLLEGEALEASGLHQHPLPSCSCRVLLSGTSWFCYPSPLIRILLPLPLISDLLSFESPPPVSPQPYLCLGRVPLLLNYTISWQPFCSIFRIISIDFVIRRDIIPLSSTAVLTLAYSFFKQIFVGYFEAHQVSGPLDPLLLLCFCPHRSVANGRFSSTASMSGFKGHLVIWL